MVFLHRKRIKLYSFSALVQMVRMPACHAGGHEFKSRMHCQKHRGVEQLVAHQAHNLKVAGSNPPVGAYKEHIQQFKLLFNYEI